ncbi:hypothetical protein pzkkv8_129 [Klebsiella phage pzk-kv8]|nr:hypothetical protein pzkkv8_129 [Klebsiella phage pzk-kv8]
MIPIDSLVYVSTLSRSRLAGKFGVVEGIRFGWLGGIKEYVISANGVTGYVSPMYVSEAEAPKVEKPKAYVTDTDVASAYAYACPVLPLVIDPTDLLCHAVQIETPFIRVCGWVTDQWIEDGVELLNVVHDGDYSVVPRSAVKNIITK